jgi:hypothetical protein
MSQPSFFCVGACFQVREPAGVLSVPGKGKVAAVFGRGDFTSSVGKVVPLRVRDEVIGHARVREADVADDGSSVLFTYEITDLSPGQAGGDETLEVGS